MDLQRFSAKVYRGLGTPVAMACLKAVEDGRWEDLVKMRIDPRVYGSADLYWRDAQALALLKKCPDLPLNVDRAAEALRTFDDGEQKCKMTNRRLLPYLSDDKSLEFDPEIAYHLHGVRRIISLVLGHYSDDLIEPAFGPGATFSDPSVRSTIADKMNSAPSVTSGALDRWFPKWELTMWGRAVLARTRYHYPSVVRGSRFATAPKDATKDRPIGAEPSLCGIYQLGIGRLMRKRMKRNAGIDLDYGQQLHRQSACEASITQLDATLDLKNASGTVAKNLVKFFLPSKWYEAVSSVRSGFIRMPDGAWRCLEQFSSMGNGYTFELESLIFWAATKYVSELCGSARPVLVYGDDIICGVDIVPSLVPFLSFLGFEINSEKSFWEGPFRESCGGDFHNGVGVRPFYLGEFPREPQNLISTANGLQASMAEDSARSSALRSAWFHCLDSLPSEIRSCRGPKDLGDLVVHDEHSVWRMNTRQRAGIRYVRVYRPVSRGFWPQTRKGKVPWTFFDNDVVYACATYGVTDSRLKSDYSFEGERQIRILHDGGINPRGGVTGYKVGWVPFS